MGAERVFVLILLIVNDGSIDIFEVLDSGQGYAVGDRLEIN